MVMLQVSWSQSRNRGSTRLYAQTPTSIVQPEPPGLAPVQASSTASLSHHRDSHSDNPDRVT